MKINKIIALAGAVLTLFACGKQQLPYDLEGTEHGVVINIRKVLGTSTTLSTDMTAGDYKVILSLAEQQGDASMLKEAQLMAVYTDGTGAKTAAKVVTGITEFPATITIDIADACSKLGVATINVGDRIEFTPCVTLKSGTQIDGWSAITGFNNVAFTSWQQADGPLTYRVAYTAFAPFHQDKFKGAAIPWTDGTDSGAFNVTQLDMTDPANMPGDEWVPNGVTADDLVGLRLDGPFWCGTADEGITMWINTQDFTLIIPDQIIAPNFTFGSYGTYDCSVAYCEGEVDTLNDSLWFYFYSKWGPYSLGENTIVVDFS